MDLTTKRETVYGGSMIGRSAKKYFVYLRGERIAIGNTKIDAEKNAKTTLADAYEYVTRASEVRVAKDGSILVFRQTSADTAMYEFAREGKCGSRCMGRMTRGDGSTARNLAKYADYVVGNYDRP
jgi:hypothetical protein